MMKLSRERRRSRMAVRAEESWADSAFWGATMTLLVVVALLLGVGYFGYASMARPDAERTARDAPASTLPAGAVAVR